MKNRLYKVILAAVIGASVLGGCSEISQNIPDTPEYSDKSSSSSSEPQPSSSSKPQSSSSSKPQSSSSSKPQSSSNSKPQSSGSSKPQSSSNSKPQYSSSSKPQSSSSSKPQSSSSSKPQSSSSSKPQSSSSSGTTPATTTSLLDNYTSKWAYNQLTEKQKQIYSRLFSAAGSVKADVDISDLNATKDEVDTAFWAFDYESPQFLELGSGYRYSYVITSGKITTIKFEYGRTSGAVPHSEFKATARTVLTNAEALSSDYEKLKYVHDWIVNNTAYTITGAAYESEADGPIVYGKALCEGYSKAFMYFAQSMGFDCICAVGWANGGEHMWNMVKLGGKWYNVDVTWDDPLVNNKDGYLRHDYFLISDSALAKDHTVRLIFNLPSAPGSYAQ